MRRTTLLFPILLSACGPLAEEGLGALATGHRAPERLSAELDAALLSALDRLIAPAQLGLPAPFTGRLEIVRGQVTSAEPSATQKLIVVEDGRTTEIEVTKLEVDGTPADATGFSVFSLDHDIELSIRSSPALTLHVSSSRRGGAVRAQAAGQIDTEMIAGAFELTRTSLYQFENDTTGTYQRVQHDLDGQIDLGEPGRLSFEEFWDAEYVATKDSLGVNRPGSTEASAQSSSRTLNNNRLERANGTYVFANVRLRRNFRDGKPNDFDRAWSAEGAVKKAGETVARYRYEQNAKDYGNYQFNSDRVVHSVSFVLEAVGDQADRQELEHWNVN